MPDVWRFDEHEARDGQVGRRWLQRLQSRSQMDECQFRGPVSSMDGTHMEPPAPECPTATRLARSRAERKSAAKNARMAAAYWRLGTAHNKLDVSGLDDTVAIVRPTYDIIVLLEHGRVHEPGIAMVGPLNDPDGVDRDLAVWLRREMVEALYDRNPRLLLCARDRPCEPECGS